MNPNMYRLLPLWLGLTLLFVPFFSIWRVGVLSSFYLENGSLMFALLFVLMSVLMFWHNPPFSGSLKNHIPPASMYFLILAIFWATHGRIIETPYIGQNDMVAWTFVVYALLAWACRAWVVREGQERVVNALAWIMMLAACLQGVVAWLQYSGAAARFSGYLMYRAGIVEGQLGQYNHLGHFMMWGILATGYLWGVQRIKWTIAIPVLLYLTATTGIITSRALIAYVMAMAILLPTWRILAGKSANRVVWCMGVATAGVIVFQFALEPILHLFNDNANVNSSLERLSGNSHEGSGRSYEWKKAWQVFLSAPIWGHGWGSYPLQSFLLDGNSIYKIGFRQYDPNVLFTHSHNSFLNLLAEMGLIGTVLVLGGLARLVSGCLKNRNAANLLLLALMAVSLTHSVLEYPLWYIYFLTAFVLFPMFMSAGEHQQNHAVSGSLKMDLFAVGAFSLLLMVGIIRLWLVYQDLLHASNRTQNTTEKTNNMMALLHISQTEPMLAYYADLNLLGHIDTNADTLPTWANKVSRKTSTYRPYANAYKWGLVAYRTGQADEAKKWLHQMYVYYPTQFHVYGAAIMNSPHYTGLQADYTASCQAYYAAIHKPPVCAEPLPAKNKIK